MQQRESGKVLFSNYNLFIYCQFKVIYECKNPVRSIFKELVAKSLIPEPAVVLCNNYS